MKTALLMIATGMKYWKYVPALLDSANEFFVEHEAIVWSDNPYHYPTAINIIKEPLGFPGETLYRYHTFMNHIPLLRQYDQLFYIDVDMRFVAPIGEEIFSEGITATLHPGYVGTCGVPERRLGYQASIPSDETSTYFCGGFNGGRATDFIYMARRIRDQVDTDAESDIIPIWHDESYLNHYLHWNPPAKILDPSYCYPESASRYYTDKWNAVGLKVTPKILALNKGKS